MSGDDQEMLEKLRRLREQAYHSELLIRDGCVVENDQRFHRTSPDTFEVGDFIVKNRFVEPRGDK